MKNVVYTNIEEELETYGQCFIQTLGISMEPIIHNRSTTVVLKKLEGPPKLNDVVLFRRSNGEQVLHRVVKVREHDYLCLGDNLIYKESVRPEMILGVMKGYFDGEDMENYIDCESLKYQQYMKTLKRRYVIRWMKALPSRIKGKVRRFIFKK